MWARCSPDPTAFRSAIPFPRVAAFLAAAPLLAALLASLADPSAAAERRSRSGRARLDVVTEKGDTIPIVREVNISREGIRIHAGDRVEVRGRGSSRVVVDASGIAREVREKIEKGGTNIEVTVGDSLERIEIESGRRSGDIVSMFQDVHVPPGRTVNGDVVSVFGDVDMQGAVEGDVVAVCGSVTVGDSARVGGEVVAVCGVVHAGPTSEIQGESISLPMCGGTQLAPWLPMVASAVSLFLFLVLGAVAALLFPERLARVAATVSRRTFLSLVLGAVAFPLLPVVFVLLLITVIGIPVALLLLFLFPVAAFVGYIASCALLGARFRGRVVTDLPVWPSALLGVAFVGIFFLVGGALTSLPGGGLVQGLGWTFVGLGVVIGSVSALLGLGALFLSRFGEPERPAASAALPGAPAPASAGLTGPPPAP